jgi:hypothetical protein
MRWIAAGIIVFAELVWTGTASAQVDHKQVLVLYSTRRDAQFSIVGESELPRILDAGLGQNLDYYSEFIDISRFPEPGYRQAYGDFLRLKYQGIRFDLVIAMQEAATEFIVYPFDSLFRNTPLVFLTNTPIVSRRPNSTGLVHERDFAATVGLMRQLQPDLRDVFIVTGNSATDEEYENAVRRQLMSAEMGVTFTYLDGLPTRELEERISTLPPHSAVYHVLVTKDGTGERFRPLEYVNRVTAAANAPTYSWVDSAMGHGIVGGSLYSQSAAIERVAQLALRVLRGESPDSIPVTSLHLNENHVDWRQLRRWHR